MFGKKKKDEKEKKPEENKDQEKIKQEELKDKFSKGWLKIHVIFEVIGKPAEYIDEILKKLIEVLEKEKNVQVLSKEQKPAQVYEETLFCGFVETEILIESTKRLFDFVYDYMPSSIEVLEPSELRIKLADANMVLNELATKLHQQDIALKKVQFERDFLIKKLKDIEEKK